MADFLSYLKDKTTRESALLANTCARVRNDSGLAKTLSYYKYMQTTPEYVQDHAEALACLKNWDNEIESVVKAKFEESKKFCDGKVTDEQILESTYQCCRDQLIGIIFNSPFVKIVRI